MKTQNTSRNREHRRNASTRSGWLRLVATGIGAASSVAAVSTTAFADNPSATVNVDANANRRAISPLIYGANWSDQATVNDLNLAVNRRGGNATTTYNWQINATNRAGDWYFESLSDGGSAPSASADDFITSTKAGGWQTTNGTQIQQWTYGSGNNQRWVVTSRGNNQYSIVGVHSGKAIDIDGWNSGNGTKIQLWDYSGSSNQKFTFSATDGGYYRITPTHATGSCLDVADGSTANGALVQLWTYGSGSNQQWVLQTP